MIPTCLYRPQGLGLNWGILSWSMLGHVLSKEQSKDGSDRASNDGRLTIVQCHHYHWPPSSDLYRSSVGILYFLHSDTTNKLAFLSLPLPTSTMCYLPQHNQSPPMLHTCSMFKANHIMHAPACTTSRGHGSWSPQGLARI